MMHPARSSPSGPCAGLAALLLAMVPLNAPNAKADGLVRFHCHGMMGGHQNGIQFDALLDADFSYDAARGMIYRYQNGKAAGNWPVKIEGQVLRWTSDETHEFLDLSRPAYGFDWHGGKNDVSYGRANCTRQPP